MHSRIEPVYLELWRLLRVAVEYLLGGSNKAQSVPVETLQLVAPINHVRIDIHSYQLGTV